MAHRVISLRCGIWPLSGHSGPGGLSARQIYGSWPSGYAAPTSVDGPEDWMLAPPLFLAAWAKFSRQIVGDKRKTLANPLQTPPKQPIEIKRLLPTGCGYRQPPANRQPLIRNARVACSSHASGTTFQRNIIVIYGNAPWHGHVLWAGETRGKHKPSEALADATGLAGTLPDSVAMPALGKCGKTSSAARSRFGPLGHLSISTAAASRLVTCRMVPGLPVAVDQHALHSLLSPQGHVTIDCGGSSVFKLPNVNRPASWWNSRGPLALKSFKGTVRAEANHLRRGLMKSHSDQEIKHAQVQRNEPTKKRKNCPGDRYRRSIDEGWDVGGPRWRIGWGGLPLEDRRQITTHSERQQ